MKFSSKDIVALSGIALLLFLGLFVFAGCESPNEVEEPVANGNWRGTVIILYESGQITETYDLFLTIDGDDVTGTGSLSGSANWSIELEGKYSEETRGTDLVPEIAGNMTMFKHGFYNRYTSFVLQLKEIDGKNKLKGLFRSDVYGEYPIQLGEKFPSYNVAESEYPQTIFEPSK